MGHGEGREDTHLDRCDRELPGREVRRVALENLAEA